MNWKPAAALPLALALWACAEGGTRGSGISTSVLGNVVSVESGAAAVGEGGRTASLLASVGELVRDGLVPEASARSTVGGIYVSVEGTHIGRPTDDSGDFSLRGDFEGMIVLLFTVPDEGGMGRLTANVPAAGTLTLNNVHVDVGRGEAVAESADVAFKGILTGIDCEGMLLTLVSAAQMQDDTDEYTLRLDNSSVVDAHGNPVACTALQDGDRATVRGKVEPDGTFGNAVVELEG